MPLRKRSLAVPLLVLTLTAIGIGAAWTTTMGRAAILSNLCRAGLPNYSRPSSLDAHKVGCTILGPRQLVTGALLSGFEASNLIRSDLSPPPEGGGPGGSTWFTCGFAPGCSDLYDIVSNQKITGLCDTQLVSIKAYGWATVEQGYYGHLGSYAREFFVDKVVNIGPPPADLLSNLKNQWAQLGIGEC